MANAGDLGGNEGLSTKQKQAAKQNSTETKKRIEEEAKLRKRLQAAFNGDEQKAEEALYKIKQANEKKLLQDKKKQQSQDLKDYYATMAEYSDSVSERMGAKLKLAGENLKETLSDLGSAFGGDIEKYANLYARYSSSINARLQGTDKTFTKLNDLIQKNLSVSPFVKQEDMLESLNTLIQQGIAYNVEQRAFLGEISDKIATTFEVANSALIEIIRIQQADSTQARLGMEAYLTSFLNSSFQDTSYLTTTFDNVTSILQGIESQLGRERGVELEYVVQKWLGSLQALGMSSDTLTTIAQGINYLGTGNVSALSSNSSLQNLLVMSANRSGVSYSDMLTKGVDADTANALLKGMVLFMQDIAKSENQVVKAQYADLFGMTISDMSAILNVTAEDLKNIAGNMLSYQESVEELTHQLQQVPSRLHLSEMLDNLTSNAKAGIGAEIANSPGLYATWMINDLIEQATGGINIPFISAFGSGVDLNANVNQLVKLGIVGIATLGQIGNIIGSLSSLGGLNLSSWGYEDYTSHGTGFTGIKAGVSVGAGSTAYIGNSSGDDMYASSLGSAYDNAQNQTEITGQDTEDSDKITPAVVDEIQPDVHKIYESVGAIYDLLASGSLRVISVPYTYTGFVQGQVPSDSTM